MKPTNWKEIAELVGIAAIVASLVFVGIETRNSAIQAELNTQAIEISAYQELIGSINRQNDFLLENPELRVIWRTVISGSSNEVTRDDEAQVGLFLFTRFRHGDMAYFQYERGAIDEPRMKSAIAPLIALLKYKYVREWWIRNQVNFVAPYREFIDRMIEESGESENLPNLDWN